MRQVVLFTTFFDASPAYSLNVCVQDQIRMLIDGGYKPTVIVVEGFKPVEMYAHPDVTLAYIPHFPVDNDGNLPGNYKELVAKTREALLGILKDADICITHDIIYQPAHLIHNFASREVAELLPHLRWLHWIHSATSPEILCSVEEARPLLKRSFPNSLVCYPNFHDIPRVAENYGYRESDVKFVPHPIDIAEFFGMHEASRRLLKKHKVLDADFIACYPIRLDRGKQPEHIIKLMGAIKKKQRSVRLIMMDFHSTGGDKVVYREDLKRTALEWGVSEEIIWLSEFDPEFAYHAPRQMVRDFMLISNFFVQACVSETYSYITQEASLCKNVIVLNRDFPPMRSLWGKWPIYWPFSSAVNAATGLNGDTKFLHADGSRREYPENQNQFYDELALRVIYEVENNPALMEQKLVRQERTIEYVFKHYVEPLFAAQK